MAYILTTAGGERASLKPLHSCTVAMQGCPTAGLDGPAIVANGCDLGGAGHGGGERLGFKDGLSTSSAHEPLQGVARLPWRGEIARLTSARVLGMW